MDIVVRATVVFLFLYAVVRIIGRRELSSLEPFDLIVIVVVGDLVQQGVTQDDYSLTGAVLAVSVFALLTVLTSWLSFRFRRLRPLLDGRPIVLLENGRPLEQNIRRERITIEEIAAQARLQQIDSLDKVQWAVLETSGEISFLKKQGADR
jgi:uncharacterized membrane protein YcaP (DUF421 family)